MDPAFGSSGRSATSPLSRARAIDEVLFEVAESELTATVHLCSHAMRHAFELEVPLVVGVEAGKT